jgi:hypothetical protein
MKKKEKRKKKIPLLVIGSLIGLGIYGCDYDPSGEDPKVTAQRDIYTKFEDCVADWGDKNLCQQMQASAEKSKEEQRQAGSGGGHTTVVTGYPYFYGPTYYGNDRIAHVGDRQVSPLGNRASNTRSAFVRSSSLPTSVSRSIAARGGFGSAGRSVGMSSGS